MALVATGLDTPLNSENFDYRLNSGEMLRLIYRAEADAAVPTARIGDKNGVLRLILFGLLVDLKLTVYDDLKLFGLLGCIHNTDEILWALWRVTEVLFEKRQPKRMSIFATSTDFPNHRWYRQFPTNTNEARRERTARLPKPSHFGEFNKVPPDSLRNRGWTPC